LESQLTNRKQIAGRINELTMGWFYRS